MKGLVLCVLLVAAVSANSTENLHPLSDEYIAKINEKAITWKAGRNFDIKYYERLKRMSNGFHIDDPVSQTFLTNPHNEDEEVPESFDSRTQWPNCQSIREIRDQSGCGSCWAFSTTSSMSDRICIHSNQTKQTRVSAEDLNSCCTTCGYGCDGGNPLFGWEYWQKTGIVTGGLYQGNQGCKDFTLQPCEHHVTGSRPNCTKVESKTPACTKTCQNSKDNYESQLTFGLETGIFKGEKQIQLEIMKNGPISCGFNLYDDLYSYKSGVYRRTTENKKIGGHAGRCIGWGVENGVKYWLIANSWNQDWGEMGYLKFIRGENDCYIENHGTASLPKL